MEFITIKGKARNHTILSDDKKLYYINPNRFVFGEVFVTLKKTNTGYYDVVKILYISDWYKREWGWDK